MITVGVPPGDVRAAGIEEFLAEFTERGKYTVSDLIEEIEARDRQCWAVLHGQEVRAVALTQISGVRKRVCHVTHLTGDGLNEWKDAFLTIESWARSQGCVRIEALARPGYERVGKPYGLRKSHVLLEKDL